MRIDLNPGAQPAPESNRNQATNSGASAAPSGGRALGEDQAQLSGAHIQVQALAAQALQLPELREERVQALRQAVQSGQYQVRPEKIAGSVLAHMIAGSTA